MKGMCVLEETEAATRLQGYVHKWFPEGWYGFITVAGAKEGDGRQKQWHFHVKSLKPGTNHLEIGVGTVVRFTPLPLNVADKRDKAVEIEVVG